MTFAAALHSQIVLLSQSELTDDCTVTLNVNLLEVVEQVSSVTDHLLQTAAAVEVLLVGLQVLGQVVDTGSQNGNLYFGRTGVALVGGIGLNQVELFFFLHGSFHLSVFLRFTQQSVGEGTVSNGLESKSRAHAYAHIIPQ